MLHLQALNQTGRVDGWVRVQVTPGETVVVLSMSKYSLSEGEELSHVGLPC